jgi:hypothetical protein
MDRSLVEFTSAYSVGRVLRHTFGGPDRVPESVLQRGIDVHEWTEHYDLGQLVTPAPHLKGWCDAYKAFTYACSPSWEDNGVERIFDTGSYHGVVDRIGSMRGHDLCVADIKTGAPRSQGVDGIQLAAYTAAIYPKEALSVLRVGIYIKQDGTWKLRVYDNPKDFAVWNTLLQEVTHDTNTAHSP